MSQLPPNFEQLDFTVEEEHWNEYELSDGSRIKGRVILQTVRRNPNDPSGLEFRTVPPIFVPYAPVESRGEMNNEPRPEEYEKLPREEVKIIRNDEKWNRYRVAGIDRIFMLRLSVGTIYRVTNRYTNDGLPFYLFSYTHNLPMISLNHNYLKPTILQQPIQTTLDSTLPKRVLKNTGNLSIVREP